MTNRLLELRSASKISLATLSKSLKANYQVKVSPQSLMRYEKSETDPRMEIWEALADFFGVDVQYIQGLSDDLNITEAHITYFSARLLAHAFAAGSAKSDASNSHHHQLFSTYVARLTEVIDDGLTPMQTSGLVELLDMHIRALAHFSTNSTTEFIQIMKSIQKYAQEKSGFIYYELNGFNAYISTQNLTQDENFAQKNLSDQIKVVQNSEQHNFDKFDIAELQSNSMLVDSRLNFSAEKFENLLSLTSDSDTVTAQYIRTQVYKLANQILDEYNTAINMLGSDQRKQKRQQDFQDGLK